MSKYRFLNAFQLKVIALISMTIDHIGYFIFPNESLFRIIGRIAFVVFAFFIANGLQYTSNKLKYGLTLLLFGLIIEIFLQLFSPGSASNIFLSLSIGYFIILFIERKQYLLLPIFLLIPNFYNLDYGYYGILLIIVSYYFYNQRIALLIANLVLIAIFYLLNDISILQFYSIFGSLLILYYNDKQGYKFKYFFYLYYPIHIVIINIIASYFLDR